MPGAFSRSISSALCRWSSEGSSPGEPPCPSSRAYLPATQKLLSLFEEHTQIITRHKAGKMREFGREVLLDEVDGGIISRYEILSESGSEHSELPESLKAHQQRFARAPHLLASDRGLYSVENERLAQEAGVKCVAALPKSGKLSEERKRHEKQRWFSGEASALGRASREHPRKGLGPSKYLGRINRQCRSRIQPKQWAPYYCTIG